MSKNVLDKYEKENFIQSGGTSDVYLAKDKETNKKYAAKIINTSNYQPEDLIFIEREISIMKSFNDPTIIKLIDFSDIDFDGNQRPTIIMEYAKNGSIEDIIKKCSISQAPKEFTKTLHQIVLIGVAHGMKYLHEHRIIHRNLSSGNILLNDKFHPLIADFGFSKEIDITNALNQSIFCGTCAYQAPEIIRNEQYDKSVDVYAFGIIMYEIVEYSFAYPELIRGEISEHILSSKIVNDFYRPTFHKQTNEKIKELIMHCWSNDPKKRPSFAEIYEKLKTKEYFLKGVNEDDITDYIEEYLEKNEIAADDFNSLNLKSQSEIIQRQIENDKSQEEQQFLQNINDLVQYLLQYDRLAEMSIEIDELNENRIKFGQGSTELLFDSNIFNDSKVISILNKFTEITFEVKYPSNFYAKICNDLFKPKKSIKFTFNITFVVYISDVSTTDQGLFNNKYINKVILDKTIESIKSFKEGDDYKGSFEGCESLNEITIPQSVTSIGPKAFSGCKSLQKISIPKSLNSIKPYTFNGCESLIKIIIPKSVTSIEKYAFNGCTLLSEIRINGSLSSIKEYAFAGCVSLTNIDIPSSVNSIEEYAFSDCSSLEKIIIPSIKSIKVGTFAGCVSLRNIQIPPSVISINSNAFKGCKSLKNFKIPSSVKNIAEDAFGEGEHSILKKISSSNRIDDDSSLMKKEIKTLRKEIKFLQNQVKQAKKANRLEILKQSSIDELTKVCQIGKNAQCDVFIVSRKNILKVLNMNNISENQSEKNNQLLYLYWTIQKICHPNIIKSVGFCFGDETHAPSILMQYCPYNLGEVVNTFNTVQKICSIYEISIGMEAIHAANLIHRDLKPENILIDEDGHVQISGLDLSCVVDVENQARTPVFGSVKFMSPELLNESQNYSNKVDVYSFGVVMYFILTNGNYPEITIAQQSNGEKAHIPSKISKMAKSIISLCWEKNDEDRPSFSDIVEIIKTNNFNLINKSETCINEIKNFLSL